MIHRLTIGSAEVSVLGVLSAERTVEQVSQTYPDVDADELAAQIPGGSFTWSFNLALIEVGDQRVLIDTGFRFRAGDDSGGNDEGPPPTLGVLSEAGASAEGVTTVVLTHAHGDHLGGLLDDGVPAFSNAELVLSAKEAAFWTGPSVPDDRAPQSRALISALDTYADRVRTIEMDGMILDHPPASGYAPVTISAIPAPGHTPGHIGVEVASGEERLWLMVDTLHAPFQFSQPGWSPRFDSDPARAAATRRELLARAADESVLTHFFHIAFPGLGRVRHEGDGFAFDPV